MNKICGNCFKSKQGRFCPYCGYDEEINKKKYPLALPAGTILDGRFIIGNVLGQGGFGITYSAREYGSEKLVAIKEYFPEALATRTQQTTVSSFSGEREESFNYGKDCFLQEAQTLAEFIGIPAIVRIYSYFEENNTAYFVMEYLEGISLLDHVKQKGGRISWKEMRAIADPVMDALSEVHARGIVHRDISPDNIFLCTNGQIKIIDFGAARYSLGDKSRSLDVLLKHGYAPKEQYARHGKQGPFTDIYALAATMYRCVTGELPPDAPDRVDEDTIEYPRTFGVNMTPAAEAALMQALAVNPADRFSSVSNFKKALDSKSIPQAPYIPDEEPPVAAVQPYEPEKKSSKAFVVIIAVCCVVVAAGIVALFFAFGSKSSSKDGGSDSSSQTETVVEKAVVPDVTGDSESTAKRKLEDAGFEVIVEKESDSSVESGFVIRQSVSKGVELNKGSKITITVSTGAEKTEVPSVIGDTESAAKTKLTNAKLTYKVEKEYSDSVEAGLVISQSESAGTKVSVDTTVTITVSKGVEDKGELTANDNEAFSRIYSNMRDYVGYTISAESMYIDKLAPGSHFDSDALWMGFPPDEGGSYDTYCVYDLDNVTAGSASSFVQSYVNAKFAVIIRDNTICVNLVSIEKIDNE